MEPEESFNDILRELDKAINEADNPKNENYINRTNTVYDIIADIAGLEHRMGNVYALKTTGQQFIRTKFGFQPEEIFNKGLQLTQLKIKYEQALDEIKNKENKELGEFAATKNELEQVKKKLALYMVSIDKLTALKKELTLEIVSLTEKNNRLNLEKLSLKHSTDTKLLNEKIQYQEKKIGELTLTNKKLNKEIEILEKKQNAYIIVPNKKWK